MQTTVSVEDAEYIANYSILSTTKYRLFDVNPGRVFHMSPNKLDVLYSIVFQTEFFWDRFSFGWNPARFVPLLSLVNKAFHSATVLPQNMKYVLGTSPLLDFEMSIRFGLTKTDISKIAKLRKGDFVWMYDAYMYRYNCSILKKKRLISRNLQLIDTRKEKEAKFKEAEKLVETKRKAILDFMKEDGMDFSDYSSFIAYVSNSSTVAFDDNLKAEIRFRYFVDKFYRSEYFAEMRLFKKNQNGVGSGSTKHAWEKMKENLHFVDFSKPYVEIIKPEDKICKNKTSIF